MEGLGRHGLAQRWLTVTAVLSVSAAAYFVRNSARLFDYFRATDLILGNSRSRIAILGMGIPTGDTEPDFLWELFSDSVAEEIEPEAGVSWLAKGQPGHRIAEDGSMSLLDRYFEVVETGRSIEGEKLFYDDPVAKTRGHFILDAIRLSKGGPLWPYAMRLLTSRLVVLRYLARLLSLVVARPRILLMWSRIDVLHEALSKLERQAVTDELTGLSNRYALRGLDVSQYAGTVCIDLDGFKAINDTFGHDVGDALLVSVAGRLREFASTDDLIVRLGGDEFSILVAGDFDLDRMIEIAEHLLEEIQYPYTIEERQLRIDASIGVVDRRAGDLQEQMRAADIAMFSAKEGGGGVAVWDKELIQKFVRRNQVRAELRRIRDRYSEEFVLYYQPIVDLNNTDRIIGTEALIRWPHSLELGVVSPGEFIPIAEGGEINRITEWVIGTAAQQAAAWGERMPISVNVSPYDLIRPGFVERLYAACDRSGTDVSILSIEVTEREFAGSAKGFNEILSRVADANVIVRVDDFGIGSSGIARFRELYEALGSRFQVKIDRSFVPESEADENRAKICRSICSLCGEFGVETIAEGIEPVKPGRTQSDVDWVLQMLRDAGVKGGQGFYFGHPAPANEIDKILHRARRREPQAE